MSEGGRWAIYSRLSIAREDGGTHALQVRECRRWVAERGGTIALEASDDESGLVASRPGYQRIIAAARRREIDGIVVWRWDRFGRDLGESSSQIRDLRHLGIQVVSVTEGDSNFLRNIMLASAEEESERLAARIFPRQLELARAGRMVTAPAFGYRLEIDPDSPDPLRPKRRLIVHEPEAAAHRELCDRFLAGASYQALSEWLFQTHGYRASWSGIRDRLANPVYAGYATWNRRQYSRLKGHRAKPEREHVLVAGAAPAILDAETYARVRAELARRYRNHGRTERPPLPLVGLMYCGCGRRMYGSRSTYGEARPNTRPGYFYRCNSKFSPEPCPYPGVAAGRLEWAVAEAILVPLPEPTIAAALEKARRAAGEGDRGRALRRQAVGRRAEVLRERASKLIDRLLDGTLTPEAYGEKAAEIDAERRALAARIEEPIPAPVATDLSALAAVLRVGIPPSELATSAQRRRLFAAAVARADWGGVVLEVRWTPAMSAIRGEEMAAIAPARRRRTGGYQAWELV